jgi:PTS system beta-glucosides-specific IIC component
MSILDKLFGGSVCQIGSPVAGEAVSISQVNDQTFSHEILGRGIAIRPAVGKVCAPCDGVVEMVFETGHAVSMTSDCGAEILIHIGLDTVNLQGRYFTVHCAPGDRVEKGQLLVEFDKASVEESGYDVIVPLVICNSDAYASFRIYDGKLVSIGDAVIELEK